MEFERLSVIVCSRNGSRTIGYALSSLAKQSIAPYEIIVVDDGSTDATLVVAQSFANVIVKKNETSQGVSASRNLGASAANGEWLAFLDDDDWWPPDFVAQATPRLQCGSALCYDNEIIVAEAGDEATGKHIGSIHRLASWVPQQLSKSNMHRAFEQMPMLKSIISKNDFEKVGGFDPRFLIGEDFYFHLRLLDSGVILDIVDEPRGFYRKRASSVTGLAEAAHRHGLSKSVEVCFGWRALFLSASREITMTPVVRKLCDRAIEYWTYRTLVATLRVFRNRGWPPHLSEVWKTAPIALAWFFSRNRNAS